MPQGSILGPLLFLIYVNDINNAVTEEFPRLFADDTNLFLESPDYQTLQIKVNRVCKHLEEWLLANRLSLNITKTNYLLFKPKNFKSNIPTDFQFRFFGTVIQEVSSSKYLGVFIDNECSWIVHIDYVYDNLMKFCGLFYRIRDIIPEDCARTLYFSFVHTRLLYGLEVYGSACATHLNKLMKLNNKILRIILHKPFRSPTIDLYNYFNILLLTLQHDLLLVKLFH